MHNTEKSVVITRGYMFFKSLLLLYPKSYRKKFESEMLLTFEDIYCARLMDGKNIGFTYWFSVCLDIIKNAFEQHVQLANKQGMKKYLHNTLGINRYNIWGIILLLPFLSMFFIDVTSRIAQGDLTRYNRPVYSLLSHTIFYQTPILFIWAVLFPVLAVLLNSIPLIRNAIKKHGSLFHIIFLKQNIITLLIVLLGLGFLALIKLHDFAPCVFHGLLRLGIGKLPDLVSYCKNA